MKNPHVSALAAAHGVAVLFGLTGILGALIRFDAVAITAGRAGFAATALLVLALAQRRPLLQGLGPRRAGIVLASGFLLAVHWITFFMAVKVGGVAVATLGFASFPAFIALLDVMLFRERIGRAEGTMLALVTLGLVLVTPSFDVGDQGTVGLLWGLASGLSFAGLAICNRRGNRGMDAIQVAFWQNLVVALLVLPLLGLGLAGGSDGLPTTDAVHPVSQVEASQAPPIQLAPSQVAPSQVAHSQAPSSLVTEAAAIDWASWFWLAVLGVLCTGLAHTLFVKSLESLDARRAGMIIALEPVYAIACAWWLFGEEPSGRMLVGASLIILATVLLAMGHTPTAARKGASEGMKA
ncbi:MAG: DMT family transporter [Lautropia mirabilis]|nr:DMT family transporter [Lautropia mirabilis]